MSGNHSGPTHVLLIQIPAIVFLAVAPLFVLIRVWSRYRVSNGLGSDDWTIMGSLVSVSIPTLEIFDAYQNIGRFYHCVGVHVDLYGIKSLHNC